MKEASRGRVLFTILLLSQVVVAKEKSIDGDQLFNPNQVIEIQIKLPPEDWSKLCRQSRNPSTAFTGLPSENHFPTSRPTSGSTE